MRFAKFVTCVNLLLLSPALLAHARCGHADSGEENAVTITPVAGRFVHAEGPHWSHRGKHLYFVDIDAQQVCRFEPSSHVVTCCYIENGPVGFAVPVDHDDLPYRLVAGAGRDFVQLRWNADQNDTNPWVKVLTSVDEAYPGNRWNDGKADSQGRMWAGTIGPEVNERVAPDEASLYRIGSDLKPIKEVFPVTNSNGLAWNLQDNRFYYIDTPTLQIAAYDYEPISGTISNRSVAFDLVKNNVTGWPDGMTIDTDGNLWIALYNGGAVINVDPRSHQLLRTVKIPAEKVTSVAFGGPMLDTLYVTTSGRNYNPEEPEKDALGGYIFTVTGLGVLGTLANEFRM